MDLIPSDGILGVLRFTFGAPVSGSTRGSPYRVMAFMASLVGSRWLITPSISLVFRVTLRVTWVWAAGDQLTLPPLFPRYLITSVDFSTKVEASFTASAEANSAYARFIVSSRVGL